MDLTAGKLLGGTYGAIAIVVSLIGGLLGFLFIFTSTLAGLGLWFASFLLFTGGLLSFGTTRGFLANRLGLSLSGGAAGILVGGLSAVSVVVFTVALVVGLLAAGGTASESSYTGPGHDVSNVSMDATSASPADPTTAIDVTWNARAQSAVNPNPDSFTKYSADDGEKYIVTRMQIENSGDSEIELTRRLFQLEQNGVVHDARNLFGSSGGLDVTLQPGAEHSGYVVFAVPEDATEGTIIVDQDAYFDATVGVEFEHDPGMPIEMAD